MFSWDPPSLNQQNGQLTHYHVTIEETQVLYGDDGTTWRRETISSNRTYSASVNRTQVIDALEPHHNYTIRIAAATRMGLSSYSPAYTATTIDGGEFIIHYSIIAIFGKHDQLCEITVEPQLSLSELPVTKGGP